LPEKTILIIHRLIVPIVLAAVSVQIGYAWAQGAFPAPLPGQQAAPPPNAFPPVNGAAPTATIGTVPGSSFPVNGAAPLTGGPPAAGFGAPPAAATGGASEACMKGFIPLREEAEKRGKLIKAAGDRHASPDEACKLIGNFGQSELKMIKYVEANSAKCGIPAQVADQLKAGHKNTEALQKRVCNVAEQVQKRGAAGPSLSEVLGSATSAPEATAAAKKGGSTFDTLNGNVLER
jgi:hypothetical protein